jgi:hypothetical protein
MTATSEPHIPTKVDTEKWNPNSVFTIFGEKVVLGGKKTLLRTTSEVGRPIQKGQPEQFKRFLRTNSDLGRPAAANKGPLPSAATGHGQPFFGPNLVHDRPSIKPASHATEKRSEDVAVAQFVAPDDGVRRSASPNNNFEGYHTAQSSLDHFATSKMTNQPPPPPRKPIRSKAGTYEKVPRARLVI